jgi:hypothetical protein
MIKTKIGRAAGFGAPDPRAIVRPSVTAPPAGMRAANGGLLIEIGRGGAEAAPVRAQGLMCSSDRYAELDRQRQTAMGFPQPAEPLGQLGECRAASQVERKS